MKRLLAFCAAALVSAAAFGADGYYVFRATFDAAHPPTVMRGEEAMAPEFAPSPSGQAVLLPRGTTLRLPAADASDLREGFTLRMWMRLDGEAPTRTLPLVNWPGVLTVQVVGRSGRPRPSIVARVQTDQGEFSAESRHAAPIGQWMLLSVAYHPDFNAEGHLSSGAYRPTVATTGLLVVTIGGVHDEPFGRSWFGAEAFGALSGEEGDIVIGGGAFEGALDEVALIRRPVSVAFTAWFGWMARKAREPLAEPEADAATLEGAWGIRGTITHLRLVPTLESISVYALHATYPPGYTVVRVSFREKGADDWRRGLDMVFDRVAGVSRGSVLNLKPGTEYEVRCSVETIDQSTTYSRLQATTSTWPEQVPVGEVRHLPELTEAPLVIREQGAPDAWIVYRPAPGASARIEAGEQAPQAVLFDGAAYVAIENVAIRGGARHAVNVFNSRDVRIVRCDIAQWGEAGTWQLFEDGQGRYIDSQGRRINHHAGVYLGPDSRRVLVDGNFIHSPRGTANSWAFGHPAGPQAVINAWTGGANVIRNNDMIGSEKHWWNDAIEGAGNGSVFGGPYRDTDISGNVIAFANDDGTELDGGQINVRFWNNRVEDSYCALSTAPNLRGPSYVFRNLLVAHHGDERGVSGRPFKMGTGVFPIFGVTFLHHNTTHPRGPALASTNTSGALMRRVGERWGQLRGSAPIISRNNIYGHGSLRYPEFPALVRHGDFARDMIADGGFVGPNPPEDTIAPPARFLDDAGGDFRLADDSPARDAGVPVPNVSDSFYGQAPDLGAIESRPGAGAAFPVRPSGMFALPPRASMEGVAGQPTETVEFQLTAPTAAGRTWRAHPNAPWLRCEPSEGETSDQPITVRVSVAAEELRQYRGAVTFRTDEGHNCTVMVNATLRAEAPFAIVLEAEDARIERLMPRAGDLAFRLVEDRPEYRARASQGEAVEEHTVFIRPAEADAARERFYRATFQELAERNAPDDDWLLVRDQPVTTGEHLSRVYPVEDEAGGRAIGFELRGSGARAFADVTGGHIDHRLAIVMGDTVYSAPTIRSRISGRGVIIGRFTEAERDALLQSLGAAEPATFVWAPDGGGQGRAMQTAKDPKASGGAYVVSVAEPVLRFDPDNPPQGRLVFEFDLPKDGEYYLLGRVISPGPDTGVHDSFFYALNDDEPRIWDTRPSRPDAWEWRMVRASRAEAAPVRLERGRHRLTLWSRERLTAIDALAITDNPYEEAPPGWGR